MANMLHVEKGSAGACQSRMMPAIYKRLMGLRLRRAREGYGARVRGRGRWHAVSGLVMVRASGSQRVAKGYMQCDCKRWEEVRQRKAHQG